jgi:hypothetical protein
MAKQILIEIKSTDAATATIKKTEQAVTSLGKKTTTVMNETTHGASAAMGELDNLGGRFRYLSIVVGMLSVGAINMVKGFIEATKEMEAATLRLGVFAESSGQSMDKAKEAALSLAATGLVSVTEASTSLANLLATGLGIEDATTLLQRMLDTAVLSKESLTDTFGKALEKSTLGVRILQERQVDAIGINFRADQVWREYGKTIDKTTAQMTTQEKQQAIVNYLLKETERFAGGADLATQTFGGTLSKLSSKFQLMKAALGESLVPLIGTLATVLTAVATKITNFAKESAAFTSIIIAGTVSLTVFATALAAIGAMLPMITAGLVVMNWSAIAPLMANLLPLIAAFLAISVAIGGLIYIVLKATGKWDEWRGKYLV